MDMRLEELDGAEGSEGDGAAVDWEDGLTCICMICWTRSKAASLPPSPWKHSEVAALFRAP